MDTKSDFELHVLFAAMQRQRMHNIKQKHHREFTPYGLCYHQKTYEHYLFNRDYLVLPLKLPELALIAIIEAGSAHERQGLAGHGRLRPKIKEQDRSDWYTQMLFHDGTAPTWYKKTWDYDKTPYE